MKAHCVLVVTLLLGSTGCASGRSVPSVPKEIFPNGSDAGGAMRVPCPEHARGYLETRAALPDHPPTPIPGDDGIKTTITVVDDALHVDVVGWQIRVLRGSFQPTYVAFAPFDDVDVPRGIAVGDTPHLEARVLVKVTTRGGLFEDLSYCYERLAYAVLPEGVREANVLVQDDETSPLRFSPIARFDVGSPVMRGLAFGE